MIKTVKKALPLVVLIMLGTATLLLQLNPSRVAIVVVGVPMAVSISLLLYAVIRWDDAHAAEERERRQLADVVGRERQQALEIRDRGRGGIETHRPEVRTVREVDPVVAPGVGMEGVRLAGIDGGPPERPGVDRHRGGPVERHADYSTESMRDCTRSAAISCLVDALNCLVMVSEKPAMPRSPKVRIIMATMTSMIVMPFRARVIGRGFRSRCIITRTPVA